MTGFFFNLRSEYGFSTDARARINVIHSAKRTIKYSNGPSSEVLYFQ